MLLVPTELRPSSIQGIGTFILAPAKKGDLIWRFDSRIDRVYSESEVQSLPPLMQSFIRKYAIWHKATGLWMHCGDNARHYNHSENPTTISTGSTFSDDVAAHDLIHSFRG